MPIDATVGGASANSYVAAVDADAYFASRVGGAAWAAASAGDREIALIDATRQLDRLRYKGQRASTAQALEFPRSSQRETGRIPSAVRQACCEHALWLLSNAGTAGRNRVQQLRAQGVTAFQVGDHSQEFASGGAAYDAEKLLAPEAVVLLRSWLAFTGKFRRCK